MVNKNNKLFRPIAHLAVVILPLVFLAVLLFPTKTHAVLQLEPAYSVLKNTNGGTGAQIKLVWKSLIDVVNYFVIAVLIFVAFAQILRLNINTYGIKKILPALILAIIGANFSFLFCRLLIDLANITMTLFWKGPQPDTLYHSMNGIPWADPNTWEQYHGGTALKDASLGTMFWFMFAQLFVLVGGIMLLVLSYLFFIRLWLIYFLVALSPLAFMATVLSQTKSVFSQWMSNFAKWVFLPVVSIFWIWLGNKWVSVAYLAQSNDYVMTYVFAGVCYYLAVTTPFKMGGAVMTAWGNLGKRLTGKPAGWALNKAKEKWVDPMIKEWKDRTMFWYYGQASGSQSKYSRFNPIGAIARRALRKEDDRKDLSDRVATAKEGAIRWAYGGKPIEEYNDPITGKKRFKYKFFSDKGRERKALLMDSVKSDMGEYDYIRKQLDLDWKLRTKAGQEAVGRSVAYAMRATGVDNNLQILDLDARGMAYSQEFDKNGKPANWFLNNTSFGIVAGDNHWKRQKEFYVESQQNLERASMLVQSKMENDRIKFDYQPAATLTLTVEEYRKQKRLVDALKNDAEAQIEGTEKHQELIDAMDDLEDVTGRLNRAMEKIQTNEALFKDGKFTSNAITLKQMLTDSQGNFVGNDYDKIQSLTKLWGYDDAPEDLRELFLSRLRKATSVIAKEEVASESSKRISVESARRGIEKFHDELIEIFSGAPQGVWLNEHKDAFAALKNSLVNARDENAPEIYGEYVKLLSEIATSDKPEVTDEMRQNVLDILANAQKQSMSTSLQQSAIMDGVLHSAAKEELKMDEDAWKALGSEGQAAKLAELRSSKTFRDRVSTSFVHRATEISRQSFDDLSKVLKIKYDKHGQVHVFVDTSDTALAANVLGSMSGQAVRFNEREKTNAEGQQRLSTIAGLVSAMPTSEEAITSFLGNIEAKGRKKKRDRKKSERRKFDEIE